MKEYEMSDRQIKCLVGAAIIIVWFVLLILGAFGII